MEIKICPDTVLRQYPPGTKLLEIIRSAALKGRPVTPETRAKMSAALKGWWKAERER